MILGFGVIGATGGWLGLKKSGHSPQDPCAGRAIVILDRVMKRQRTDPRMKRDGLRQMLAVGLLLAMAGFAVAGPSGIVTWSDNQKLLEQRQAQIAQLTGERDELKNKVDLLDPNHTDTDFAGELVRNRLNVVHRDDRVMLLHEHEAADR